MQAVLAASITGAPGKQSLEGAPMIVNAFRPAAALMSALSYPRKFALIGLVLFAPLAFAAHAYLGEKRSAIDFSDKERVGIAYVKPAATLLGDLVRARARAVRSLAGLDAETLR